MSNDDNYKDFDNFSDMVTNYFKNDYRERGKVKWQGFFLSDHNVALDNERIESLKVTRKLDKKPLNECKDILLDSSMNYRSVLVQLNNIDIDHRLGNNIIGIVGGFTDNSVLINDLNINFEDIRTVIYVS